ncbi:hypothetical protein MMC2321_02843 [Chitinophaga sp. MM2321]
MLQYPILNYFCLRSGMTRNNQTPIFLNITCRIERTARKMMQQIRKTNIYGIPKSPLAENATWQQNNNRGGTFDPLY